MRIPQPVKTGGRQIANRSVRVAFIPRTSVTVTVTLWTPDPNPAVLMRTFLSVNLWGPGRLNVRDVMIRDPTFTLMVRIPGRERNVMFGNRIVVPLLRHAALIVAFPIAGPVHAGVYLVLQRAVAPDARLDTPTASTPATNEIKRAFRTTTPIDGIPLRAERGDSTMVRRRRPPRQQ